MRLIALTVVAVVTGVAGVAGVDLAGPHVQAGVGEALDRSPAAMAVISQAELSQTTLTDISDLLARVPAGVSSYRYGDNPQGSATLDPDAAPAATPDLVGAVLIGPGDLGFASLGAAIHENATAYAESGAGLVDTHDYAFFIATRDEASGAVDSPAGGLAQQIDFPIGFTGNPGWVAQPQFPGDTWQGGALVLSGQRWDDGQFQLNLIDTVSGFAPRPFDGFFATGPDWAIAAVDLGTLTEFSAEPMKWAFASHVHDGRYGQCGDCASIITTYPQVPRTVDALYAFPTTSIELRPASDDALPEVATGDGFPFWLLVLLIVVVVVLLIAIAGWFVVRARRADDDCTPLYRAWQEAVRRTAVARELLESAHAFFEERMQRVAELEALRADYQRALDGPKAGSGKNMFAKLDGELILVDGLAELIAHVDEDLSGARRDAEGAKEELDRRLKTFEEREAEENSAREAYEACVGAKAVARAAEAAAEATATAAAEAPPSAPPATPATITRPVSSVPGKDCGCDPAVTPGPVAVPIGAAGTFRLFRDFDVISQVDESSEHGADKIGAEMVTGLKDAGTVLETIGSALSGGSAARSGAAAVTGLQSGQFVKGSLQAVKGTVEGLGAIDVIPNIPTSLPEAVANGLAATANLGAFVAGKVTEWMGKNTLVTVHASFYYQQVTIQPTQIWACEEGVWRCVTKVNVYTVGTLKRERGRDQQFTVKSDPERRELRRHLAVLAAQGRTRITSSVQRIAEWEAAHPTGDCG